MLGIGRNDRMAIVLGNGPHMASAFVTIAAGATTAPLNPAYRADEFEFYLNDLQAKTLLVELGVDSPASAVAQKLGVQIVELCPDQASGAGVFTLEPLSGVGERAASAAAEADDVALILHTSDTTSRPKMVALTQRNITASARHIMTMRHRPVLESALAEWGHQSRASLPCLVSGSGGVDVPSKVTHSSLPSSST